LRTISKARSAICSGNPDCSRKARVRASPEAGSKARAIVIRTMLSTKAKTPVIQPMRMPARIESD